MFTGIIEGIGQIVEIQKLAQSSRFSIQTPFGLIQDRLGDSVAVNGCCLTITDKTENQFSCDLSPETLARTAFGSFKTGQ